MTIWKVGFISALTTLALVAVFVIVTVMLHRGSGHGVHGFGSGVMGAHRMRAQAFSSGHRDVCAHLDDSSVNLHAEVATLWIDRRLDLTDAQRAALAPVIDGATSFARELAPLCDVAHDDAKTVVSLVADMAEVTSRSARRIDDSFDAFYDALDEDQRAQLDNLAARHRGMRHR